MSTKEILDGSSLTGYSSSSSAVSRWVVEYKRGKQSKRGKGDLMSSPKPATMDHQFEFMLYVPVNIFSVSLAFYLFSPTRLIKSIM